VSHPAAIEVDAADGCVHLSGPVLADEVEQLVECVRNVRGVRSIDNELEVFDEPGNVSALQGGRRRTGPTMGLAQQNWSPTAQAMVGLAGLGLAACCALRGNPLGTLVGAAGLAASFNALTHIDTRRQQRQVGRGEMRGELGGASGAGTGLHRGPEGWRTTAPSEPAVMHDL
jgi:hypothetical protein